MNRRDRVAQVRASVLASIQRGERPFDHACVQCAESKAVLILDDARGAHLAELARDDCPRYRMQRIRRVLAIIDERFDLLMRPAAPGVH